MTELAALASHYGWPALLIAAAVYVVLKSDIRFVYPRKKD